MIIAHNVQKKEFREIGAPFVEPRRDAPPCVFFIRNDFLVIE